MIGMKIVKMVQVITVKQLIKNATAAKDNNIILLFHDANGKENS